MEAAPSRSADEEFAGAHDDLDGDQNDYGQLKPQRATRVDDVGENFCGFRDHPQLLRQYFGPFLQFVFVLEAAVEPVEIGALPDNLGLLGDGGAPGYAMLNQQGLADVLEDRASSSRRPAAFGENYVQEGIEKIAALAGFPLQWSFVGPIQSNKTRLIAEHFDWVHSVSRLHIAERLARSRPPHRPLLQICIQVNVSGEASKSGVMPEEARALAQAVAVLPGLQVRGLMAVPEPTPDTGVQRARFRLLREIRDEIRNNKKR